MILENKIYDVIRRMAPTLNTTQLQNLTGIKKSHPHNMRRTSIINAVNRGMPIQEAALFAGHVSTETTLLYWTADQEAVRYHHKKYLSA